MRRFAAALLLALAALPVLAQQQPQQSQQPQRQQRTASGPAWASLTVDQQRILAPLAPDWDKGLTREQKVKWVGIAKRYPRMKPEEQKRVQTRMQKWAKLTPEQRWQARERYRSLGKIAPDRREELRRYWAEYQSLPPHEKRMFDVPPSYVPPTERRKRTRSKPKPASQAPSYSFP